MINISVIVPVYLAEEYIIRCLESLRKQTMREFEVILVDDGSPDLSGKICEDYAAKDSRFRVIHKKNGGVSSARQVGIDNAIGEYVIHTDPDDWVEPDMLDTLYSMAKSGDYDVVICDFFQESKKTRSYKKQQPTITNNKAVFDDLISGKLHGACWNKLVRRSCFSRFNIKFPPNVIMWEDLFVNLNLFKESVSIAYLPEAFYHYDQSINPNSAILSYSHKKLSSQKFVIDWLFSHVKKKDKLNFMKKSIKYTAFRLKDISKDEFKNVYPEINNLFAFNINQIGKIDFFIFLSLRFSLPISRFLYKWKYNIQKKIMG